jgi:saccharopine dehydrogenase-like NADP-dependent oxidoreductase
MDMAAVWDLHPDKNAKSPYKIEQFDFDAKFEENGIIGLIEAGVSPGMTNLLCRECAEEMDSIDTIKIRLFDHSGTDDLTFAWSKEALLDELASKPLVYRNGKFKIVEPFSEEEEFDYPQPFGKKRVHLLCQDEIGTIPFFIKLKNIDIKDYNNQIDVHTFLYKLGLISQKKISIGNTEISPFEFMCKVLPDITLDFSHKKYDDAQFAFVVQANGKIGNANKTIRYFVKFPRQKEINKLGLNANFISYPTALSAKLFVMTVPGLKKQGIFPPEALDNETRKLILDELRKTKNIVFKKEIF